MSHNDASTEVDMRPITTTHNDFWEIGSYKSNILRINQGYEQLDDLVRFIKERVAIESRQQLERWNSEWNCYAEKHFKDCLSLRNTFDLILGEGRELAKIHHAVKERFVDEVLKTIELFKRDNYHKSTFRGFKEAKEIEDEFEKAQKQWKKLIERLQAAKRNYHSLSRAEKSAYIQYMNSKADQYNTDCSTEKCKESFEKLQEDRKKAKVLYEQQLTEVTAYIGIYKENMSFVFAKCQRMEKKRIKFMVEMFSGIHRIMVDLVSPQKLIQLHAKMKEHFVELGDNSVEFDLRQWSIQHGIECSTKWPEFEEYSCEFRHIHNSNSRSRKQCRKLNSSGVVLTKKVTKDDDERSSNELRKIQNGKVQQFKTSRCSSEPRGDKTIAKEPEQFSGEKSKLENFKVESIKEHSDLFELRGDNEKYKIYSPCSSTIPADPLPLRNSKSNDDFAEIIVNKYMEQFDNSTDKSKDYTSQQFNINRTFEKIEQFPIGPAKVIYNFIPNEPDEIPLVLGEVIDVLSGPDSLGWCLGVKRNKERGLKFLLI